MKGAPSIDRALENFGDALQTKDGRRNLLRRALRVVRLLLLAVALLYLVPLAALVVGIHWWAEANMALVFCAYLPAHLWILPAPVLFVITLPFSWRLASLHLVSILLFFFGFMDYQGARETRAAPAGGAVLSVLSNNRGQHLNQSLQPFKNAVQPDIIALQESYGRAPLYARAPDYSEFPHVEGAGEFVLLSRYPIRSHTLLSFDAWNRPHHIAARFEIDFNGRPVAVYSVHMPTVRDTLMWYRRGAFLYGVIGIPGTPFAAIRRENQEYWNERIRLARRLADAIAAEKLPCLVVGDFNMPDHGYIYRMVSRRLRDAHEQAGGGFGYTFPGTTRNPLTLWGPWLRLDYVFTSEHWSALEFVTEKHRISQHRAIYARLLLR